MKNAKQKWKSGIHYRRQSRPRFGDRPRARQGLAIVVVLGSRDAKKGEAAAAKLRDEGITAGKSGL